MEENGKKQRSLYVSPELDGWLVELAQRERRSVNGQIEYLLESAREASELPAREYDVVDGVLQPDSVREVPAREARPDPRGGRR